MYDQKNTSVRDESLTCCFMAEMFTVVGHATTNLASKNLRFMVIHTASEVIVFGNWLAKILIKNLFNYVQVYACQVFSNIKYYVLEGNLSSWTRCCPKSGWVKLTFVLLYKTSSFVIDGLWQFFFLFWLIDVFTVFLENWFEAKSRLYAN